MGTATEFMGTHGKQSVKNGNDGNKAEQQSINGITFAIDFKQESTSSLTFGLNIHIGFMAQMLLLTGSFLREAFLMYIYTNFP